MSDSAPVRVQRGFAAVGFGQIHYREAGTSAAGSLPLVLFHASPGSSKMLEPLLLLLAESRRVLAFDTAGNGDSSPVPGDKPEIVDLADAALRAIDRLGLERFDVYGTHTGANIAMDIAITQPARVRKLILDGVALYPEEEQRTRLASYAKPFKPCFDGSQLIQVWHFVRDQYIYSPWYKRQGAYRLDADLPSPQFLHEMTVEVLKAIDTYHYSYNAAFRYPKAQRLPLLNVPTLIACAPDDTLFQYLDGAAALVPHAEKRVIAGVTTPEAVQDSARAFTAFLDSPVSPPSATAAERMW